MRIWWLLLAMTACNGDMEPVDSDESDTDTDADTDSDTDTDTDSDSDTDADPDPMDGLVEDPDCEGFDGVPVAGATGFYIGDYTYAGDAVEGLEYLKLFANDEWVENGGYDCTLIWVVTGTKGDPVSCATCDYSITITGTGDKTSSDCPAGLEDDQLTTPFDVTYNVKVEGDATTFYFTSGTQLGTGWTNGTDHAWWRDEGNCKWF